jgi:uncharacterized membrane protein (DUF373 family)
MDAMSAAVGGAPRAGEFESRRRWRPTRDRAAAATQNVLRGTGVPRLRIGVADDLVNAGHVIVLMIVAGAVLVHAVYDLASSVPFAQGAGSAVDGVLVAIIIMELMRTVMAHFSDGHLELQPFLVIGIISSIREMLAAGVQLQGDAQAPAIHLALLELGVNSVVVLGLAGALVLIRRMAGMRETDSEPTEES